MPRKRKLIRCAEEKLIKNERKKHSKCTTNLPQSIEASAVENWMNQCKVFNSLRLFICKWPGRDTSPEITWQAWPGHTTTTHISHTNWDRERGRDREREAGFVSDARLSCISCGQSIDNLTSLSLRLARTSLSLSLSVRETQSQRCLCLLPCLATDIFSLWQVQVQFREREKTWENIFFMQI